MTFKGWDKIWIVTHDGPKEAVAPVVVTASRSTDIPAFFLDWFMNRLREGYVKWINPFSNLPQYVSFQKTRVIVWVTKNALPMLQHLNELDQMGYNYYVHFTVNDYEAEGLEPNVPLLTERLDTFKKLSGILGKERVIWRFDPLIIGPHLSIEQLLAKVQRVGDALHPFTERLVFSFADIESYQKVRRNLIKDGFEHTEFNSLLMEQVAEGLAQMNKRWGLELASCAETIDLSRYSIRHNCCIDGELMARLFPQDRLLMGFLGIDNAQTRLFQETFERQAFQGKPFKDKGQRKGCHCIPSKDVGHYSTCMHLCKYCYANASESAVRNNLRHFSGQSESIVEPENQ